MPLPNIQNLPIHTTTNIQIILLPPHHPNPPLPTNAALVPDYACFCSYNHDHCHSLYHLSSRPAVPWPEPDPLFLRIRLARRAPGDFPAVATCPEAASWIPLAE